MSLYETTLNTMTLEYMSEDKMALHQISVDRMSLYWMTLDEMPVDITSLDEMFVDKMTCVNFCSSFSWIVILFYILSCDQFYKTFLGFNWTTHFVLLSLKPVEGTSKKVNKNKNSEEIILKP